MIFMILKNNVLDYQYYMKYLISVDYFDSKIYLKNKNKR